MTNAFETQKTVKNNQVSLWNCNSSAIYDDNVATVGIIRKSVKQKNTSNLFNIFWLKIKYEVLGFVTFLFFFYTDNLYF